MILFFMEMS